MTRFVAVGAEVQSAATTCRLPIGRKLATVFEVVIPTDLTSCDLGGVLPQLLRATLLSARFALVIVPRRRGLSSWLG